MDIKGIGHLNRTAARFPSPLSDQDQQEVIDLLSKKGSAVIGSTLLAVDRDCFFEGEQNPTGAYILSASDDIYCAAKTGCAKGISEAILWAESQPVDEDFLAAAKA